MINLSKSESDETSQSPSFILPLNAIELGDFDGALKACEAAIASDAQLFKYCPALVYAKKGDKAKAYQIISGTPVGGAVGDFVRSMVYSMLGDKDKAFELLEKFYRERSPFLANLAMPGYDNLRDDPRFKDLLKRMNLPE